MDVLIITAAATAAAAAVPAAVVAAVPLRRARRDLAMVAKNRKNPPYSSLLRALIARVNNKPLLEHCVDCA
jgi:hypothetical protein